MDDYLSKPIHHERLRELLQKWLPQTPTDSTRSMVMTDGSPVSNHPNQPPIDETAWDRIRALQRPNRPNVLNEFLTIFLNDSPLQIDSLRLAIEQQDASTIYHASHTLKSSSAFLGAHQLSEMCKELELMGRSNNLEGASSTFKNLETEYAVVSGLLTEHLNRENKT